MQAINIKVKGIKCDHCDFQDATANFNEYEVWLNKPCPQCGANLLTEADMKTLKTMIGITNFLNCVLRPFVKPNAKKVSVAAEMNGTGKVTFRR
jgi:phage FluMu protein Com